MEAVPTRIIATTTITPPISHRLSLGTVQTAFPRSVKQKDNLIEFITLHHLMSISLEIT